MLIQRSKVIEGAWTYPSVFLSWTATLQEADARLRVAREEQRCGLMSGKRAADVTMALLQLRGTSGSERQRVLSALDVVFHSEMLEHSVHIM